DQLRQQSEAAKKTARPEFDKWLAEVRPGPLYAAIPHEGLQCQALLSEGGGNMVTVLANGQQRPLVLAKPPAWLPGQISEQAFKSQPQPVLAIDEAGDFDRDQAFSYGAWVRLPRNGLTGSLLARMDDQHEYRGWDLWLESGKLGVHLVNRWPD